MAHAFKIVGTVSQAETLHQLLQTPEKIKVCDVVELRFDQFMQKDSCLELCKKIRLQKEVLLTIRTNREGGTWEIDDEERYKLFQYFAPHVDMIDIEIKSELFAKYSRQNFPASLQVIASYHDYHKTPSENEINQLIKKAQNWQADIVKLALFTHNENDVNSLKKFLCEKNICLIGMGPAGVQSRLEFPLLGSCLTYGFLDQSAAPGQISARELSAKLRKD